MITYQTAPFLPIAHKKKYIHLPLTISATLVCITNNTASHAKNFQSKQSDVAFIQEIERDALEKIKRIKNECC